MIGRLICRILGGHHWTVWHDLVFTGWLTTAKPQWRFCHVCLAIDRNQDALVLSAVAAEFP